MASLRALSPPSGLGPTLNGDMISKNSAPSRSHFCRALPVLKCSGTKFKTPWWNGPEEWRTPDDCKGAPAFPQLGRRAEVAFGRNSCNGRPTGSLPPARRTSAPARMKVGSISTSPSACNPMASMPDRAAAISRQLALAHTAPPRSIISAGTGLGAGRLQAAGPRNPRVRAVRRDMLRASMRHAGALRLDHVLGLKRLYLVPKIKKRALFGRGREGRRNCICRSSLFAVPRAGEASRIAAFVIAKTSAPCRCLSRNHGRLGLWS